MEGTPERTDRPRDQGCSSSGCYARLVAAGHVMATQELPLSCALGPLPDGRPVHEELLTGRRSKIQQGGGELPCRCPFWPWVVRVLVRYPVVPPLLFPARANFLNGADRCTSMTRTIHSLAYSAPQSTYKQQPPTKLPKQPWAVLTRTWLEVIKKRDKNNNNRARLLLPFFFCVAPLSPAETD